MGNGGFGRGVRDRLGSESRRVIGCGKKGLIEKLLEVEDADGLERLIRVDFPASL